MKLVNILVRELPEWPDGLGVFTQDRDKVIWFSPFSFFNNEWDDTINSERYLKLNQLATNHQTAIITKEMWEAAKGEK